MFRDLFLSRYYESYQCRTIAETVLRATFSSMMLHDDLDSAIIYAMQSITYNALDLSLLPVLHERYIQRIVQLEPLLGVATLGLMLGVPVVSMRSILQLMNGNAVTDEDDALAMKQYLTQCLQGGGGGGGAHMLRYMGMDEYSNPTGRFPGYVTCPQLKEVCAGGAGGGAMQQQNSRGGGAQQHGNASESNGGGGGSIFSSVSPNGVPMQPIVNICKRIYSTNQKTLSNCAFIKDFLGFQRYCSILSGCTDFTMIFAILDMSSS